MPVCTAEIYGMKQKDQMRRDVRTFVDKLENTVKQKFTTTFNAAITTIAFH